MSRLKPSSRENGRHSHGPKTQAGKDRSKFNALRHGLLAKKCILLSTEREQAFDDTLHEHIRRFHPQDEVENCLVVDMVHAQWNMFRAFAAETQLLDKAQILSPNYDTPYDVVAGFENLMASRSLDLLPRYQARLQLAYQRAIRTLILVRDNFPLDASPAEETPTEETQPEETSGQAPVNPPQKVAPTTPPPVAPTPKPKPVTPQQPDWPKVA